MRPRITPAFLVVALAAMPQMANVAWAEAQPPEAGDNSAETEKGIDLIDQGARLFMRGILDRIGPQLGDMADDLGEAMGYLAPAMSDVARQIDDIQHYHPPERLENGDIILRRRSDAPPPPPIGDGILRLWEYDWGDEDPETRPDPATPPAGSDLPSIDL